MKMHEVIARKRPGWKGFLAVLPAIGIALMPKIVCPLCWPAYAALLSVFGISFLPTAPYLLPLMVAFLVLAIAVLGWRARQRGLGPLLLGCGAAGAMLIGRFVVESDTALYGGLVVLVAAFIWDRWPSPTRRGSCPACQASTAELSRNREEVVSIGSPEEPLTL